MIEFQDFLPPHRPASGTIFAAKRAATESLNEAVASANQWIEAGAVRVLNVETVVLPNLYRRDEEGSTDGDLRTSGDMSSRWYQFVRVWYRPNP